MLGESLHAHALALARRIGMQSRSCVVALLVPDVAASSCSETLREAVIETAGRMGVSGGRWC